MNYMDFDPYLVRQRNEEMRREVHSMRLEEQLRGNARPRDGSRLVALLQRSALLLREARLPR
jgi:hypothetical protein